jgi:hypothetical protein
MAVPKRARRFFGIRVVKLGLDQLPDITAEEVLIAVLT